MTALGYGVSSYIGYLRWRKQTRLDYWKEKRSELNKLMTPGFVEGLFTEVYSPTVVSDMFTTMGYDALLIINKYHEKAGDKPFSQEDKTMILAEISALIQDEKDKCDKEIAKLLSSWF